MNGGTSGCKQLLLKDPPPQPFAPAPWRASLLHRAPRGVLPSWPRFLVPLQSDQLSTHECTFRLLEDHRHQESKTPG